MSDFRRSCPTSTSDEFGLLRSHLPLLFIGMEQIMLSNYRLADEALDAAASLCENDPLLCNERGVMAFNHGEYVLYYLSLHASDPWVSF